MSGRGGSLLMLVVCLGAAGCRHKAAPPVIPPPAVAPVPLASVPTQTAQLPTEPAQTAPIATVTLPPKPAKKAKKKAVPAPAAPAQMASAVTPPPPPAPASVSLLGSLAASGDQSAENRQKAVDVLTANEKAMASLPNDTKRKNRDQIVRIKNFQQDAQKALSGGDTEGAITLATKAKVLLDELAK